MVESIVPSLLALLGVALGVWRGEIPALGPPPRRVTRHGDVGSPARPARMPAAASIANSTIHLTEIPSLDGDSRKQVRAWRRWS
jgi:hypothetical protein